ncbi:hypothetical protein IC229_13635 [Spirosoma sp. BT702]|uniref:DUF3592 domain-containing protein n=1 Tax=Spirosoma profusum TaxID=2771354 RepID=A0A926Y0J2_9BACT|nr:DUF3592 domain-containing protein [Spirosoma profusum]MBD2701687.1 hypothetical protein [Spirosoma profusum]
METHPTLVFGADFTIIVLLLLAVGSYFVYQGYQTLSFFFELGRRGESTKGRVIGLNRSISFNGTNNVEYINPLFSYWIDGQLYEVEGDLLLFESFAIGQEMPIRFLPENPKKFTYRKTSLTGIGSLLMGLSLVALAVWLLVK